MVTGEQSGFPASPAPEPPSSDTGFCAGGEIGAIIEAENDFNEFSKLDLNSGELAFSAK